MAELISLSEAGVRLQQVVDTVLDFESAPLSEARGRRLAQDYEADTPWPSTDRSAMDGYGVRAGAAGLNAEIRLEVVGACLAGHPFEGVVADGEAIRIMTGAVVPPSVDAVVPVENTSGYVEIGEVVSLSRAVRLGDNIRPVGSEVVVGDLLLSCGARLGPAEIGALAVLGIDHVPVFRRPVVAILATGDEVVPITSVPATHQVRNSNAWALAAQIESSGGDPRLSGILPDDPDGLRTGLTQALESADVVLTIGGVSKGTHDLVHRILEELGVEQAFHGIALKPGKPTFFGSRFERGPGGMQMPKKTYVFGLPGNPASAFTVFDLLVRPMLGWLCGAPRGEQPTALARVAGQPFRKNWRLQAVPARLHTDSAGQLVAELGSSKPSGDPFGLVGQSAYALIPPDTDPGPDLMVPVWRVDEAGR